MPTSAELRAALEVAELEEQLIAAKDGDGPSAELKLAVREARRVYREMREGAAAVSPAAIETATTVNEVN